MQARDREKARAAALEKEIGALARAEGPRSLSFRLHSLHKSTVFLTSPPGPVRPVSAQRQEADTLRQQLEEAVHAPLEGALSQDAARAAEAEAMADAERHRRSAMEQRLAAEVDVRVLLTTQLDKLQGELARVGRELSERERSQEGLRAELEARAYPPAFSFLIFDISPRACLSVCAFECWRHWLLM